MRWYLASLCILSILASACGDDEESTSGQPGDPCSETTDCEMELVCAADAEGTNRCQYAAGAACDSDAETSWCVFGTECAELPVLADGTAPDPAAQCLIAEGGACDPSEGSLCGLGLSCAELQSGEYACHVPVVFVGRVFDSGTDAAIEGAHVVALDDISVAVTDVAISDADGNYILEVPAVRDAEGNPVGENFTLRASADGYQTFPGGVRTALPINTNEAGEQPVDTTEDPDDRHWVVSGTITDVALIEVADPNAARTSISGTVLADDLSAGVLVAAEGAATHTAVSDLSGAYTIFNVIPGSYSVNGYKAGVQLEPVDITVASDPVLDVDLGLSERGLTTVNGSVNIVNAPGSAVTSVVLVVESTFSDTFGRGEVPPGLRAPHSGAPDVDGSWTIEGVPDGRYVVLAAFENDLLVRDPDENIAGTDYVTIDVPGTSGGTLDLGDSFKVTEALAVVAPGATGPEAVTGSVDLVWEDDSSEEYYVVIVYNAYGDEVWRDDMVPSVSGQDNVTVTYGGPLEAGMYYQFRATSWRQPGGGMASPISTTEDLLGVFYVPSD